MISRGFRRLTVTDADLGSVIPMRFRPALFLRLLPPLLAAIPSELPAQGRSPFTPPAAAAPAAAATSAAGGLEYRGNIDLGDGLQFRLFDPAKKSGVWVRLNQRNEELDVVARRYDDEQKALTIEHQGSIPEEFREAIGNRIFGCDDCQLVCPWNKFAKVHAEPDFAARNRLDETSLLELFAWSETEFLQRTEGSAIRRTGYINWLRNLAVALGNAEPTPAHREALREKCNHADPIVREHAQWALQRLETKLSSGA